MSDAAHLAHRIPGSDGEDRVVDHWGGRPLPAQVHQWHRVVAAEYVDCLRRGDAGSAAQLLHRAKLGDPAAVDPWRLVEHIAALALAQPPEAPEPGAPEPGAGGTAAG